MTTGFGVLGPLTLWMDSREARLSVIVGSAVSAAAAAAFIRFSWGGWMSPAQGGEDTGSPPWSLLLKRQAKSPSSARWGCCGARWS